MSSSISEIIRRVVTCQWRLPLFLALLIEVLYIYSCVSYNRCVHHSSWSVVQFLAHLFLQYWYFISKKCPENCKAVCPSGFTVNPFLVLKDSVCLDSDAASHSIIHKNVLFNLLDDRWGAADTTYPLTHLHTPPFSHTLAVSNLPFFSFFFSGLKKRTRKAFGIRKKEKDNDST